MGEQLGESNTSFDNLLFDHRNISTNIVLGEFLVLDSTVICKFANVVRL